MNTHDLFLRLEKMGLVRVVKVENRYKNVVIPITSLTFRKACQISVEVYVEVYDKSWEMVWAVHFRKPAPTEFNRLVNTLEIKAIEGLYDTSAQTFRTS